VKIGRSIYEPTIVDERKKEERERERERREGRERERGSELTGVITRTDAKGKAEAERSTIEYFYQQAKQNISISPIPQSHCPLNFSFSKDVYVLWSPYCDPSKKREDKRKRAGRAGEKRFGRSLFCGCDGEERL